MPPTSAPVAPPQPQQGREIDVHELRVKMRSEAQTMSDAHEIVAQWVILRDQNQKMQQALQASAGSAKIARAGRALAEELEELVATKKNAIPFPIREKLQMVLGDFQKVANGS